VHTVDLGKKNTHLFCCHVRIRTSSNCYNFFFLKCISQIKGYYSGYLGENCNITGSVLSEGPFVGRNGKQKKMLMIEGD
jgi:hypothetical protein